MSSRYLSHEFLGGEDELVVEDPSRLGLLLKEGAVGVDEDSLLVLHRLVAAGLAEARRVVEEPRRYRLSHAGAIPHGMYHTRYTTPEKPHQIATPDNFMTVELHKTNCIFYKGLR